MLHTFQQLFGTALVERLTLFANHVLAAEPVATQRLAAHAGRRIQLQLANPPALLPALPDLVFIVTPAGLLEWSTTDTPGEPDLRITVDASNPAQMLARGLAGRRPTVDVAGDSRLANDVSWLIDNVRWDAEDDLARVVGAVPAREITRVGRTLANGLRDAIAHLSAMATRARGGGAGNPSA